MQRSDREINSSDGSTAINRLREQDNELNSTLHDEETCKISDIAGTELSLQQKMERVVKRMRDDEDGLVGQKHRKIDQEASTSPNISYENNANEAFDKEESNITSVAFRRRLKYLKTEIGIQVYVMTYIIEEINLLSNVKLVLSEPFINDVRDDFLDLVKGFSKCKTFYKVNLSAHTEFVHNFVNVSFPSDIQSYNSTIYKESDIESSFVTLRNSLRDKIASYEKEIGWSVNRIKSITMSINILDKSVKNTFIKLPEDITSKKAVINVQNSDTLCFKWALLSALYQVPTSSNRVLSYAMHGYKLKFGGVTFPVILSDIQEVEDLNDISINVYSLAYNSDSKKHEVIGPLYVTNSLKDCHVNLLCLYNVGIHHFCYIKSLSRLIGKQVSNCEHSIYICDGCVHYFTSKEKFADHQRDNCYGIVPDIPTDEPITKLYVKRFKKNKNSDSNK